MKLKIVGKQNKYHLKLSYTIIVTMYSMYSMYSPFYKFLINKHLIKQHLIKNRQYPTTIRNTLLGLMIKTNRNVKIPYSEQYETKDFTPRSNKSFEGTIDFTPKK